MGVVLRAYRVRGESYVQRNANGEVATILTAKFNSLCVEESESDILERSESEI